MIVTCQNCGKTFCRSCESTGTTSISGLCWECEEKQNNDRLIPGLFLKSVSVSELIENHQYLCVSIYKDTETGKDCRDYDVMRWVYTDQDNDGYRVKPRWIFQNLWEQLFSGAFIEFYELN